MYGVSSSGAGSHAHTHRSPYGHGHASEHSDGDRDADEYGGAYRDARAPRIGGGAGHPAATGGTRTAAGSRRNVLTAAGRDERRLGRMRLGRRVSLVQLLLGADA